jgi:hypothetical protein
MDLSWDAACMTAQQAEGTAAQCASNRATGKSVQTKLSGSMMRAIFFSPSNLRPIPDGQLFCCSFTMATARGNPCCSVNTANMILSGPTGGRLYVSHLPDISVEVQVNGLSCAASVPGGSAEDPVRPPARAAIVQPPVVSAPAPPPAAPERLLPRPNIPAEAPPVQGGRAEAPPELAPTESVPSPEVTPAAVATRTAARTAAAPTPAPPTATAPERTPQVQGTPTGPVPSVTAKAPTPTQPAATPTPKRKHKGHKKRQHAAHD